MNWVAFGVLLVGLNVAVWGLFWRPSLAKKELRQFSILPWSTLFHNAGFD